MNDHTPDRIPLAHSVRYVARGLPEVPNQYGRGVLAPSEITLTYRTAPDSQLGRVHAYVAGRIWVDGTELPLLSGGLYGQHYDEGLSNWPDWLAEEARLHDPAASPVLPPVSRADVLHEAADRLVALDPAEAALAGQNAWSDAAALLRRMVVEEQPDDTLHACPGRWGGPDCACFDEEQPATETRPACPDPIECGHEAALGLAEMRIEQVRAKAQEWTALAPADDWGNTPQDTVLADVGRFLLGLLDGKQPAVVVEQPAPVHLGGGANAENCPACKTTQTRPPYPWTCPGEEPAVAEQPDDTDLTETDIDRMMAAGTPVQIVTEPPATYGVVAEQPAAADTDEEQHRG